MKRQIGSANPQIWGKKAKLCVWKYLLTQETVNFGTQVSGLQSSLKWTLKS